MKNQIIYTFILLFSLLGTIGYSQKQIQPVKPDYGRAYLHYQGFLEKCSPLSAILVSEFEQAKKAGIDRWEADLKERFTLQERDGNLIVGAFLKYNDQLDLDKLRQKGIAIKRYANQIATAQMPLAELENFILDEGVDFVQIGEAIHQKLDAARAATFVDQVHQGLDLPKGFSGEGVLVGIMDGGFDYTHPTFYTMDGTGYRIKAVWDELVSNSGAAPNGFTYGTEVVGSTNILEWSNDSYVENGQTISRGTHGTHVAGIAGGSGQATNGLYTGVAYDSDLAMVAYSGTDQGFADGISYLFQKADAFEQPCVINMSLGKHIGPHDGTSFFDQLADQLSGPGKILVGAAGNEGEDPLHLQYAFTQGEETIYSFLHFKGSQIGTDGVGEFDLWGSTDANFSVAVNFYDVNQDQFVAWTDYVSTATSGAYEFSLTDSDGDEATVNIGVVASNPNNGKPNVLIQVDNSNQDDSEVYVMLEIVGSSGRVDAWTDDLFFTTVGYDPPVLAGDANSTCGEIGGTANSVITVGAFTTKNQFENANGEIITIPSYSELGDIAPFSSLGPTADGRIKPEITAPGNVVASAFSRFDPDISLQHPRVVATQNDGTNTWFYGAFEGTSMASPMVCGIIALMLEANPNLTYQDVLSIFAETAIHDNFTGAAVTNTWGLGKVNAWAAVQEVAGITSTAEVIDFSEALEVFPNPAIHQVTLRFPGQEVDQIRLYDLSGKTIWRRTLTHAVPESVQLDLPKLAAGMYVVEVAGAKTIGTSRLVVME